MEKTWVGIFLVIAFVALLASASECNGNAAFNKQMFIGQAILHFTKPAVVGIRAV